MSHLLCTQILSYTEDRGSNFPSAGIQFTEQGPTCHAAKTGFFLQITETILLRWDTRDCDSGGFLINSKQNRELRSSVTPARAKPRPWSPLPHSCFTDPLLQVPLNLNDNEKSSERKPET